MLKGISGHQKMLTVGKDTTDSVATVESSCGQRVSEVIPGLLSWLTILAPVWLSIIDPTLGFAFVSVFVLYFVIRGTLFGVRALRNRPRIIAAVRTDWLAKLQHERHPGQIDWRDCRVTFLIRAFREGNLEMLRRTVSSIYASNWLKDGGLLHNVEVVFATEESDPITPPLVEMLAREFQGKLAVRQIRHPFEPGTLPGPSTAMHYVGHVLYLEALRQGYSPYHSLIADFDADTELHHEYLPCLVYHFVTDSNRQLRAYQPVVAFTSDYWHAPLHSRLSAIGNTALTVAWNRRPEIAFTGAAASLALLKSVDFWPTNSHSQDSGIDLRLRIPYGRRFRVVGLPIPLSVYPVMAIGCQESRTARMIAYANSFRALFRQSARWREGPLDEFVEAVHQRHIPLVLHRLWNGLERDTVTILPGYGLLAVRAVVGIYHPTWTLDLPGDSMEVFSIASTVGLSVASLLGLIVFWQLLDDRGRFVKPASFWRRLFELLSFWVVFGVYIPILTGVAGVKTATMYLLGRRPRGHFMPTPK